MGGPLERHRRSEIPPGRPPLSGRPRRRRKERPRVPRHRRSAAPRHVEPPGPRGDRQAGGLGRPRSRPRREHGAGEGAPQPLHRRKGPGVAHRKQPPLPERDGQRLLPGLPGPAPGTAQPEGTAEIEPPPVELFPLFRRAARFPGKSSGATAKRSPVCSRRRWPARFSSS